MKLTILLILLPLISLKAEILTVGTGGDGYDYDYLQQACSVAQPGDSIIVYNTGDTDCEWIENLQGTEKKWIYIIAFEPGKVEYKGHSEAWHLTDAQYVYISGFVFSGQTGNGVNADDGGSYDTPSYGLVFDNCTWKDMNASGNNDQLKMSGVDYFTIKNCLFENGSEGGSQIDMVGCHKGVIVNSKFINGGSNAIQAKGGSYFIGILRNWFENSGQRAINIGGSTGAQFFRPPDADYESKLIIVYANYFIGSQAPLAFVGTVNSAVINNTIIKPGKWAIRILQENTGKQICSGNLFINNIVYLTNASVNPVINTGPNTAPETFIFSNNLWFNSDNPLWAGPALPSAESDGIYKTDPQFVDMVAYRIDNSSPAASKGRNVADVLEVALDYSDYYKIQYNNPPSIGACEGNPKLTGVWENNTNNCIRLAPNPVTLSSKLLIDYDIGDFVASICSSDGISLYEAKGLNATTNLLLFELFDLKALASGFYYLHIKTKDFSTAIPFLYFRE